MIYIILPVHNRIEEIRKFIDCLKEQNNNAYHLIVVDDGSTDSSAQYIIQNVGTVTILRGNGSLWWAGCLEKARKHLLTIQDILQDDVILIMNNDVIFGPDFLQGVYKDIMQHPDTLIQAKGYDQKTHTLIENGHHMDWGKGYRLLPPSHSREVNVLWTCGLYMRYEIFSAIGRFHPWLIPHYASDAEFTNRAFRKGFSLKISNRTKVFINSETTAPLLENYSGGPIGLMRSIFFNKGSRFYGPALVSFILLSCDPRHIPLTMIRFFRNGCKAVLRSVLKKRQ